jgi:hypothetical protein
VRPAHIFRYLKMGRREELGASLEYFLKRQEENGFWKLPAGESRLARALELIAQSYGRLAALLEEEYIFNWLSWDGDNVLADGSILDYGSIRQFAAKHDKYRYEDVDRFSTCLSEQRAWARLMVQAFAQAVDFLSTGSKKNMRNFREAPCLAIFDEEFRDEGDRRLLWRVGFDAEQTARLLDKHRGDVEALRRAVEYFEDVKVARGPEKLPDGITHKPVFLIRSLLRELPRFFLEEKGGDLDASMDPARFCRVMAASYASRKDMQVGDARAARARDLQECWRRVVRAASGADEGKTLASLAERAAVINHPHRMTGDGLIWIVNEILAFKDKLDWEELHEALETFIDSQVLVPGRWKPLPEGDAKHPRLKDRLLLKIRQDLELYKETV